MESEPILEEVQYPLWPFMAIGVGGTVVGGLGLAAGLRGLARIGAAGGFIAALLGLGAAFLIPMRTTVTPERVEARFGRVTSFRIPLAEIASAEAVRYRPIPEYGGWGIRFGRTGIAYSMRGDEGVQLVLRNGRRVLIGSQRAGELAGAIQRLSGGETA
jgi:hypothetical protein